jgi:hypothetical protein
LSFPTDGAEASPYPFYDRWGDAFNLSQEFVILNQARALGCLAWLMAGTSLKNQPWKQIAADITGDPASNTLTLHAAELDVSKAHVVWEADGVEPAYGTNFKLPPGTKGVPWVEVEAQWPDGRRVFGVKQN